MKTAREIIADIVYGQQLAAFEKADAILAALAAEGFSIVETGRDPVTIEACAKVADDHAKTWGVAMSTPAIVIAAAIRSLSRSTREGKTE